MKDFNDIYRGKTVPITGHTGFKGSWLSIWLKELGANVVGYALDPYTKEDNFLVSRLDTRIIDIRGDIREENKLLNVFMKYKPEFVFHLAAQPLVRLSYDIPKETYEINVMGTMNVLECIRKCSSVKVGIMITTDKCYENKEQIWGYRETDSMGGYDPYSSSKGCAELLISSYRNSFFNLNEYNNHGKAISSVRAGNVIGGGDWSMDRIIPDCIRALKSKTIIEIRNPKATRPWQHVLEPLNGYLKLGAEMYNDPIKFSGGWNFGPNADSIVPVERVADLIVKSWGIGSWSSIGKDNNKHEANLLSLDCTKAKMLLGWKPKLGLVETIKYTVDWYKHIQDADTYNLCVRQIKEYTEVFEK